MAGTFSTYLRNKLMDEALGGVAFVPSSQLFFTLFVVAPGADDLGIEVDPSGTVESDGSTSNFNRILQPNDLTAWTMSISGSKQNANTINVPTQTGTMGIVVSAGWYDSAIGGNLYHSCDLQTPITLGIGGSITFPPGNFAIVWQ